MEDSVCFKTEKMLEKEDLGRRMKLSPEGQEVFDDRLSCCMLRAILQQLDPITRRFSDKTALTALSKRISGLVDHYTIKLMAYGDLKAVIAEDQSSGRYHTITVGNPEKKVPFAVIDESARIIGVYVPKSVRQMLIERAVAEAIKYYNKYLWAKAGTVLTPEVEEILNEAFCLQEFPYEIPMLHIQFVAGPLYGKKGRVLLSDCKTFLYTQYKTRTNIKTGKPQGVLFYSLGTEKEMSSECGDKEGEEEV